MKRRINRYDNLKSMFGMIKAGQENIVLDESAIQDTESVSMADVWGWHFYARLRVDSELIKSEDASAENQLLEILNRYTNAAKAAISAFGDEAVLLEHQGELLHFHLSVSDHNIDKVRKFASILATIVKHNVIPENGVYGFSMSAQYGRSIILLVPSTYKEDSAYSRVSLGPSANSPAKMVMRNGSKDDWTLSWRKDDSGAWRKDAVEITGGYRIVTESFFAKDASSIEETAKAAPVVKYGYMFRADQDGFTKKVKATFESNDERDIDCLVEEFLSFMTAVNDWIGAGVDSATIISLPWSGDCCNMLVVPDSEYGLSEAEISRKSISKYPGRILEAWNIFKKTGADQSFRWTYGMAEGRVKIFIRELDCRSYRIFVGWPVGVSSEAVNLDGNEPEDLVMHSEDVERMSATLRNSFRKVNANYYAQSQQARRELKSALVSDAAKFANSTEYAGVVVQPSRPYSSFGRR